LSSWARRMPSRRTPSVYRTPFVGSFDFVALRSGWHGGVISSDAPFLVIPSVAEESCDFSRIQTLRPLPLRLQSLFSNTLHLIQQLPVGQRFLHSATAPVEMTRNKVLQTFGWVGGYLIVILSVAQWSKACAFGTTKDPIGL
jgi:hypothetical protein